VNLVLKPRLLKQAEKVSQAGTFISYVMVVFDNHLLDELGFPAGKQVAENAMLRAFHVQLEKAIGPETKSESLLPGILIASPSSRELSVLINSDPGVVRSTKNSISPSSLQRAQL